MWKEVLASLVLSLIILRISYSSIKFILTFLEYVVNKIYITFPNGLKKLNKLEPLDFFAWLFFGGVMYLTIVHPYFHNKY